MSIPMTRLGGRAFNADDHGDDTEREYDRLRDLARSEAEKRNACFDKSRKAYDSGDGARAKELSNEGKSHDARMDDYNRQASDFIFRANNAPGRVEADSIDLHGQFVEEAERILEERIRADRARGQTHLHAIVGKGNHSVGHVQKIKPKVEELCRELGLQCRTEENAGRIYINLQGGEPLPPQQNHGKPHGGQQQQHGGQQQYHGGQQQQQHGGQQYGGGQQQHQNQNQGQNQQQDDIAAMVEKVLPRIIRKLEKACCTVM
ncbi:Smr domain protein [Cordyceps fumosorosea ARSEF 2679]|uniref:Smr domain protein n=1 Tax=Cordyceps fumosorosea (strain ARSEF 2679) TaxID=1081104 RepID=A0A168CGY3_CORFA|nr:Smr domain protein [Cordyceps fumosorosea ARSEF 2679]OAA71363.1 Smr domain protein [Cordyceps fumosorosea ARSEF 2679]